MTVIFGISDHQAVNETNIEPRLRAKDLPLCSLLRFLYFSRVVPGNLKTVAKLLKIFDLSTKIFASSTKISRHENVAKV